MAFNLFGSIGQEDSGEKPKNTLFVLPPKNRIEEIKEKAASDAAILEPGTDVNVTIDAMGQD